MYGLKLAADSSHIICLLIFLSWDKNNKCIEEFNLHPKLHVDTVSIAISLCHKGFELDGQLDLNHLEPLIS
jgi:hypothetical protein